MAKVELKRVCKRYEGSGKHSVTDVTIDIADKEFVVLVGPSGCGKSTTLRMIAGLETVTEGEIHIDGRLVNDIPPKDRDIAMVFQNYALYPHMSVYENMAFGLRIRRMDKAEIDRRVRDAAKILDIEEFLGRKPKALSGGQRQRVAVGRAIVRQPKVFLFDEPLSNLDAKLRVQMRAEIISLHRRLDATMVYVTHDQVEAMTMGDRIVVMKDGFVQQVGSPLELYNAPVNRFVAGFIGSPPMNFLSARVDEGARGLECAGCMLALPAGRSAALQEYAGREITVGIRPEDVVDAAGGDAPRGGSGNAELHAVVEVVEPLGPETYVHFKAGNERFMGKFRPSTDAKIGEAGRAVGLDLTRAHFFENSAAGNALARG